MKYFKKIEIERMDNETLNQFEDYLIGTIQIGGLDTEIILTDKSGRDNDPWYSVHYRVFNGPLNRIFTFTDPFEIFEEGADIDDFFYHTGSKSEKEMNEVMKIIEKAVL